MASLWQLQDQSAFRPLHADVIVACGHLGVFAIREHVCHNKSGIAHRGRTRINH
jgi:hypothetical protein